MKLNKVAMAVALTAALGSMSAMVRLSFRVSW